MKKILALTFVLLLTAPGLWWAIDQTRGNGDNTIRQGFPLPDHEIWLERGYYQAIDGWFDESLPLVSPLKKFHNWLNYHIFSASANPMVQVGIHGWLFPVADPAPGTATADLRASGRRLLLTLHAAENIISSTKRRFLMTVVPTKAAIYPEFTARRDTTLQTSLYPALLAANRRHPLKGLVPLEPALIKAKLNGQNVFHERSRRWSCPGATAAARQILHAAGRPLPPDDIHDGSTCPAPDDDLYRLLLGEELPQSDPQSGHAAGPYMIGGPVATLYGDEWLNRLLPFLSPAFSAIDVIDAGQTPTAGGNLLTRQSDLILIESTAAHLSRLHLDIEALYRAAEPELTGVVSRALDLETARAVADCALEMTPSGLEIRASNATATFALPPVAGSTAAIFRMLKLTFSAAHQGTVTIRSAPMDSAPIEKPLSRGTRFVLVPLPFEEKITLEVSPGTNPGVFLLEHAEQISFYGDHPPPLPAARPAVPAEGDIYSGLVINAIAPPPPVPEAPAAAEHPTQTLPALSLTDIPTGRIFQRLGQSADIVVSGTYSGVSGPVEARVVLDDDGSVRMPWTMVDDAPQNGVFTGILHHVPEGGWYRLEVRSGLTPWTVHEGRNRWGVGMLVACIGQSNMREWFATGEDLIPSPRLMIHRSGQWHRPTRTGNGALALGNRLAARLGIPIGLLDYAVNGSGLTARADWGAGFWRDTAPDGIYRQFIDGVHRAGGAVEAVVWMQGEADAARGTISREAYRQALERFVDDQLRIDIGNGSTLPRLPFLMIPLVRRPTGKDQPCQWIRQAQMDVLDTIDTCYLAATSIDLKNHGRQHLVPEAYTTLGLRTAQTILFLAGKADYYRGPTVSTVTRASPTAIDITIRHRGGNDFTPATGITGFSVVSGDEVLPVSDARRRGPETIRLDMEHPLPPDFHVRYLYGAHPDTSGAVHDNTALHLPLDPFAG